MNDYGVVTEAGTVRFERLLPGPIERVWAYLTESDKRGAWLATGALEQRPGARVELHFRHADLSPTPEVIPDKYKQYQDGASFTARVTRCEPPRLLSHTWAGSPGEEDSEVTFELTPQGDDVLLVLTHRRIARREMVSVAGGWHTHLGILAVRLHGRVPEPFWTSYARLEGQYEKRIAAA